MENAFVHPDYNNFYSLIDTYCFDVWKETIRKQTKTFAMKKGSIIFHEGTDITGVYILKKGKVKVYTNFGEKQERIIRLAMDNSIIGHRGIGDDFLFSVSAMTLEDSELDLIPLELFMDALKANNEFCYHFMLFMSEELKRSEKHMKNMSYMTVKQRVAIAICNNYKTFGYKPDTQELTYTMSRSDIASMAATTYESVIRTLSELDANGYIKAVGKSIQEVDEGRLRELVESVEEA